MTHLEQKNTPFPVGIDTSTNSSATMKHRIPTGVIRSHLNKQNNNTHPATALIQATERIRLSFMILCKMFVNHGHMRSDILHHALFLTNTARGSENQVFTMDTSAITGQQYALDGFQSTLKSMYIFTKDLMRDIKSAYYFVLRVVVHTGTYDPRAPEQPLNSVTTLNTAKKRRARALNRSKLFNTVTSILTRKKALSNFLLSKFYCVHTGLHTGDHTPLYALAFPLLGPSQGGLTPRESQRPPKKCAKIAKIRLNIMVSRALILPGYRGFTKRMFWITN